MTRYYEHGNREKRDDSVCPNASLEFHLKGQEDSGEKVSYDLAAILVHKGNFIDSGHYYIYFRKQVEEGKWEFFKYDDMDGIVDGLTERKVLEDAAVDGYLYFYRKRENGARPPPGLPYVEVEKKNAPAIEGKNAKAPAVNGTKASVDKGFNSVAFDLSGNDFVSDVKGFNSVAFDFSGNDFLDNGLNEQGRFYENQGDFVGSIPKEDNWFLVNLQGQFEIDSQKRPFPHLKDLAVHLIGKALSSRDEYRVLNEISGVLKRTIFLVDPRRDHELVVLDGDPFPGENFRYGEDFSGEVLYLFKRQDESYAILRKKDSG